MRRKICCGRQKQGADCYLRAKIRVQRAPVAVCARTASGPSPRLVPAATPSNRYPYRQRHTRRYNE